GAGDQHGGVDDYRRQQDEGIRRGESGVDGELQRVRQRRHSLEPDDAAGRGDDGDDRERRRDISDHPERRGRGELNGHVRRGHADGHEGTADDHRDRSDEDIRRREPDADGDLQRVRERRYGGEPDDAAVGYDHGDRGERRRIVRHYAERRRRGELYVRLRERDADGDTGRPDRYGGQQDEGVRCRESGADGELQRLRQRRHGREPDDGGDRVHDGDDRERRRHGWHHRQRSRRRELHVHLRERHADGDSSDADGHRGGQDESLRGGESGTHRHL